MNISWLHCRHGLTVWSQQRSSRTTSAMRSKTQWLTPRRAKMRRYSWRRWLRSRRSYGQTGHLLGNCAASTAAERRRALQSGMHYVAPRLSEIKCYASLSAGSLSPDDTRVALLRISPPAGALWSFPLPEQLPLGDRGVERLLALDQVADLSIPAQILEPSDAQPPAVDRCLRRVRDAHAVRCRKPPPAMHAMQCDVVQCGHSFQ
jgi:hypothetical protein